MSESTASQRLRQQSPTRPSSSRTPEQKIVAGVDAVYAAMEKEGFINPRVRLPASHPHSIGMVTNGELRKSELREELEKVLNAPCAPWVCTLTGKARSKARGTATTKAKTAIAPILAEIEKVKEEFNKQSHAIQNDFEKIKKETSMLRRLESARQQPAGERLADQKEQKALEKQSAEIRKIIDGTRRQLLSLSQGLPSLPADKRRGLSDFIDCQARTDYRDALKDGFDMLLDHKGFVAMKEDIGPQSWGAIALEKKKAMEAAHSDYLSCKERNRSISAPAPELTAEENAAYKKAVVLHIELKKALKKMLPEGLPRGWEHLQSLVETLQLFEQKHIEKTSNKELIGSDAGIGKLTTALAMARHLSNSIFSNAYEEHAKFDRESEADMALHSLMSSKTLRTNFSKAMLATASTTAHDNLPGAERFMKELDDVNALVKTIRKATGDISGASLINQPKEERSLEKFLTLAHKLTLAARDYDALHQDLFEKSKEFPAECKAKTDTMLHELQCRAALVRIEAMLVRMHAKYELKLIPETLAAQEKKGDGGTIAWTSQAAQQDEVAKKTANTDVQDEVTDTLLDASDEETAVQQEEQDDRRLSLDDPSMSALSLQEAGRNEKAEGKAVGEPSAGFMPPPAKEKEGEGMIKAVDVRPTLSIATSIPLRDLRNNVRTLQQEAEQLVRNAGAEKSRHTSAITYASQSNALEKAIAGYTAAAAQYDKAIKAMEDGKVTELGFTSISELNDKRKACHRKAVLHRAFLDSPKSKPLDLEVFRTLFKDKEKNFTASLPKDKSHFFATGKDKRHARAVDMDRQTLEFVLGFTPVTSPDVDGALAVPYKYYIHPHYDKSGKLVSMSAKTEKYRHELTHMVAEEVRNEETGEIEMKEVEKPVPRVVIPPPDDQALLQFAVDQKAISSIWL